MDKIIDILLNRLIGKKKILNLFLDSFEERARKFTSSGYLVETGWWKSFEKKQPVDMEGQPVPWITYGAIEFLKTRLDNSMSIFEFGSGNSSLYYAKKVNKVVSVEHHNDWFNYIKEKMPSNVEIFHKNIESVEYTEFLKKREDKFDVIIVDGRERVQCILNSINNLSNRGVVILDDSQREKYLEGESFLLKNGFKKIAFWGIAPSYFRNKSTTIFYKENNCFNI
jgi:precorrin-6B methylase 2